ncbi:conserved hypothetical protein [Candidatus Sulfopaludibacter sp. SbA3]|nr:conserved hypothetical protein [Candidatus Sulfopaludibacter sp. SbA3]
MPIVKITGQGIAAIALSVALLWGCWITTRITMRQSLLERARVMRELERLQRKQQPQPVSTPHPHRISATVSAG